MKKLLPFSLLLYVNCVFGQSPEQVALDYYARNILNQTSQKKIRLRYDKHINPIDSQYQELGKLIVSRHHSCKNDPRGGNNTLVTQTIEEWSEIQQKVMLTEFEIPEPTNSDELRIPNGIKAKKNLKYKNLKGGFIRFHTQNAWHWFFNGKFNLTIEPYVKFDEYQYALLRASKNDLEYGNYYYFKISNNEVVDWCGEGWIQ